MLFKELYQDSAVPSWLRQLVEAPTTERLTIRRVTRELHLLLEQRDLQTINILLGLSYNRQLHPSAQASLLRLTFSARHLLPAWSAALEDTRRDLIARGLPINDYLHGLSADR